MKPAKTLFDGLGYRVAGTICLNIGAPGPSTLKRCAELMMKATDARLKEEMKDEAALLQYGSPQGDPSYIQHLAKFLSTEYGDPVDEFNLVTSAGATNGLHVVLTIMFPQRCPIFVEEVSYHLALDLFRVDFKFPILPVNMDSDGLNIDDLRAQIEHAKKTNQFPVPDHGYWAILYSIPVFHNPTGCCLAPEKAKQLLELAHEHRILIITEDVYNLLYYEGQLPPKRLFAYDRERAASLGDKNGGCVISNGTFSKLLTPGLRLGWLELPPWARMMWDQRSTLFSGGSLNMYTSGIVAKALELGWVTEFVRSLRIEYKKRRDIMVEKLKAGLPAGSKFEIPKGGYFIWLEMPKNVKVAEVHGILQEKHAILFQEGTKFCVSDRASKFDHCARLAISYHEVDEIARAAEKVAHVISECAKSKC